MKNILLFLGKKRKLKEGTVALLHPTPLDQTINAVVAGRERGGSFGFCVGERELVRPSVGLWFHTTHQIIR